MELDKVRHSSDAVWGDLNRLTRRRQKVQREFDIVCASEEGVKIRGAEINNTGIVNGT